MLIREVKGAELICFSLIGLTVHLNRTILPWPKLEWSLSFGRYGPQTRTRAPEFPKEFTHRVVRHSQSYFKLS